MYKEQIETYIEEHKEEMLEDIKTLVRINSERTDKKEGMPFGEGAAKALKQAMELGNKYGFKVTNYDNYTASIDIGDNEKCLDILAHLDVVPAGEGWSVTEPFEPLLKEGRLYGRGTSDDKGPAVAALYAMRAVKELNIPISKNVRLILGTDEECGSSDIAHYYSIEKEAPMTFSPDGAFPVVNIEKGAFGGHFVSEFGEEAADAYIVEIKAGIKGNVVPGKASAVITGISKETIDKKSAEVFEETKVSFSYKDVSKGIEITANGKGAHASTPNEGNNALTALIYLLTKLPFDNTKQFIQLKKLYSMIPHNDNSGVNLHINMEDELSGKLTVAFSILNVDTKHIEGYFDSRCPICANEENVAAVVKKIMEENDFKLLSNEMKKPHHVSGDSYFVKTLIEKYEEVTGMKGSCMSMGGGTYVHNLENGVAFGASMPGTDNKMHGADEFAVVKELTDSTIIFALSIAELCK